MRISDMIFIDFLKLQYSTFMLSLSVHDKNGQ